MFGFGKFAWNEEKISQLTISLSTVFLEEWGGPRSPLALQYLHETVIPNLVYCIRNNAELLNNPTFGEIMAWKLKNQFGYPKAVADALAKDLLTVAFNSTGFPQVTEVREPWRKVFRLWVSGESLPSISERTGYPLDYLDLLRFRLRKVSTFVAARSVSLLECSQNEELREFGIEQLSFLYNFHAALSGEPLFKERMVLEQIIKDANVPLDVADLVALLEVVHANEGKLDKQQLFIALGDFVSGDTPNYLGNQRTAGILPEVIDSLLKHWWLQLNRDGKLTLTEHSAKTIAGFIVPKLSSQVGSAVKHHDYPLAGEICLRQNPEVLVKLIDWIVTGLAPGDAVATLTGLYKQINRRIDIHLIYSLGKIGQAFDFVLNCLEERDSLIRIQACTALGTMGNATAVNTLIGLLKDPVAGVREHAAMALGQLKAQTAKENLQQLAGDYAENLAVRESAEEALRQLES